MTATVAYIADSDPVLRMKMLRYEEVYFKDLTLKAASLRRGLLDDEGEGRRQEVSVSLDGWSVKSREHLGKGGDLDGVCRMASKTILLRKDLPGHRLPLVLLHEMIHAYEYQISQAHRQLLLLYLYGRLIKKLGEARLQKFLKIHSQGVLYVPDHSLLFLLKSLDLDIRLNRAFGTVAAYGRMEAPRD